ncbi:D-aminoacyl-tRNA deacylase [bacterium]|nr:D-aminoacyl-tRNA deacylase [bacterium]
MRAVVQRVSRASVLINEKRVSSINKGLVILLGVKKGDTEKDVRWLVEKCVNLRIFEDTHGKFNFSSRDIDGEILVVSQFTLYGDCRKGRRPDFVEAAPPETAEMLYNDFISALQNIGLNIQTGVFGAKMEVEIHNDGPVTLIINSESK